MITSRPGGLPNRVALTLCVVLLAGLLSALKVVGKTMSNISLVMVGFGAANVATLRLLLAGVVPEVGAQ